MASGRTGAPSRAMWTDISNVVSPVGIVARNARLGVARQQRNGGLPWSIQGRGRMDAACIDHDKSVQHFQDLEAATDVDGGARFDPRRGVQLYGSLVESWYCVTLA